MKKDGPYFEYESSVHYGGGSTEDVLRTVSGRYAAANRRKPLQMRGFYNKGFLQDFAGYFIMDFDLKFPNAAQGEYAYAFSFVYSDKDYKAMMYFRAKSPAWVYLNGELIFKTDTAGEALYRPECLNVNFKKGKNTFFVRCRKNLLGFGCEFGDAYVRGNAMNFINPTAEHFGKNGWAFTIPCREDIFDVPESFPEIGVSCGELWLPNEKIGNKLGIAEVLENRPGYAYALAFLKNDGLKKKYSFSGHSFEKCRIFADGNICFEGSGEFEFCVSLKAGVHEILVETLHGERNEWGFTLNTDGGFQTNSMVLGLNGEWLYLGMLKKPCEELINGFERMTLFDGGNEKIYWRTDEEDIEVRLSLESDLFGKWNYPIGVVLYGLSEAAAVIDDKAVLDYAREHMKNCVDSYEYAKWDCSRYGRAGLAHQLVEIDALDYCGSCGNAMLELLGYEGNSKKTADMIADYMENKQERLDNGMFYRAKPGKIHENSIWADDLYMSVPFLCRYYKNTGDVRYLDDAVRQFECFKEYLYMPEKKIMSHIYNLNYQKKNEIPWGRGNGWTAFALSELLGVLPENHPKREFLIGFFRELCEGYKACQDECGMWHQVLDESESYIESSATAMFVCAFARGIRHGWLTDESYAKAAHLGWEALCRYCIDSHGNIYGVCIGSSLSFRREYYMNELKWNINDTHGTGIILLAGAELLRMDEEERKEDA